MMSEKVHLVGEKDSERPRYKMEHHDMTEKILPEQGCLSTFFDSEVNFKLLHASDDGFKITVILRKPVGRENLGHELGT